MNQSIMPKISIIIPVLHLSRPLNKKRFFMPRYTIREVLHDIRENVSITHEVVVVCNGNDPELIDLVKTHPQIDKFCINNQNAGVARSWNMGAQLAESEVLLYLNDDVSIGKGSVEMLYETLYGASDVGEVGPQGARWRGAEHDCFVGENDIEEADAISGYCFAIRSDIFHKVGGFDINYSPAGFEEIDMSFTIRKVGMRCLVVPNLEINHYHHHGVSAYRSEIKYLSQTIDSHTLHERNKAYFVKKWLLG
ncbi:glycosyltransferase [Methylomonas montana]|uniref:glycosyltransferase family 2 protein n=1 Tax=Methylomonas montana TaxID=3058963 RepID=UPI002658A658|nr:glycosyltransferase [Methylomonas montana]WKJ92030.1 glycosyltransferase [Methylomonas montana]